MSGCRDIVVSDCDTPRRDSNLVHLMKLITKLVKNGFIGYCSYD